MTSEEINQMKKEFKEELLKWQNKVNDVQSQLVKVRAEKLQQVNSTNETDILDVLSNIEESCASADKGLKDMDVKWSTCLDYLSERILASDQYSRLNSALLHGYKNLPNLTGLDFIIFIANEINCLFPSLRGRVLPIHIDDAHSLRTKQDRVGNKVVIIKFANRWVKYDIMRCASDLAFSPFSVTEHLTPYTLKLLSLAGELVGRQNVWTFKTIVYATYKNMKYAIKNFRDLKSLECIINSNNSRNIVQASDTDNLTPASNITTTKTYEQPDEDLREIADMARTNYLNEYPMLYQSLLQYDASQPLRGSVMRARGRPSRNGRGRGNFNHNTSYRPR